MGAQTVTEQAERLRQLHAESTPLVVPNAFDAGSACVLEALGFPTIATSSAAIAWTAGAADGEALSFVAALELHGRVASAVSLPVSIDFEGGYLDGSGKIEHTVDAVIDAGVAGINLEDTDFSSDGTLHEAEDHARTIAAARAAAQRRKVPLFIVGRTDLFFRQIGAAENRAAEAVRRLSLYSEAGADCVFAPGIEDENDIEQVVSVLDVPLNVMHTPGTPDISRLAELGVGRLTFGADFYLSALSTVETAARALREQDLGELEGSATLSQTSLQAVLRAAG
jgi:2-methylisocitrate lyase-like PEP mutase family enzyme